MPIALRRRTHVVLAALLTLALTPLASAQDARTSALNDVFPSVDAATFQADADQPLFLSGDLGTVATPEAFFRDHAGVPPTLYREAARVAA